MNFEILESVFKIIGKLIHIEFLGTIHTFLHEHQLSQLIHNIHIYISFFTVSLKTCSDNSINNLTCSEK